MTTELTSTTVPAPAKRRRRWWLRSVLILLVFAIGTPILLYAVNNYRTRVAWAEAEADADRLDPGWRLTPLLNARRVVPDKENSANRIIAIAAKAKDFGVSSAPKYDEIFDKLPPTVPLNVNQRDLLRVELGKIAGPLAEARQLKNYPHGRLPVKISSIWIATLLPDLQKVRQMADWLKNDAYLLAHEERYNDAVESCRACLCAGRVVGDEPIVISHLVRNAVQLVAIDALERVLAQGVADEAVLKEMQTLLELEDKESTWLHSLRGERAGWHVMFEDIRDGRMPLNTLNGMAGPTSARNLFGWIRERFPSTILSDYPEYLQHMTQAVEIARLPLDQQRPKLQAWEETAKTTDNSVIRLAAPALAKVYNAECRSHGNLRTASVAVACERYRLANKAWPKTLDDLVKAKLIKEIPLDPIDGKPLRYRQDKEKIVIYSIGEDEKDDGGNIERDRMAPGIDVGFRLWHPHLRRLQQ